MATRKKRTTKTPNLPNTALKKVVFKGFEEGVNHQTTYSNIVQVLHGAYDFQLTFGLVDAVERSRGNAKVTALQTIVLSPQHAKAFAKILTDNVAKYENTFMKLPSEGLGQVILEREGEEDSEIENVAPEAVH